MTNKYNAKRTEVDGITFASKAEANRYIELKLLQRAGEISCLKLQPVFKLQEPFIDRYGKKQRAIKYIADFIYADEKGGMGTVVEEVKGFRGNAVWRLKKKMFLLHYPQYDLRIIG